MLRNVARLVTYVASNANTLSSLNVPGKSLVSRISPLTAPFNSGAKHLSTRPIYYKTLSETTSVTTLFNRTTLLSNPSSTAVLNKVVIAPPSVTSVRPVTKFSLNKGKRKSVKAVVKRFYRLDWGAWIRPIVGRNKKAWRKNYRMRQRAKQHVFCNATQSNLLDKMVTSFWRKPRHYVDDLYEPYHTRQNFPMTRK